MKLVSVLIPVYNTEKFIRQCMTSVLNQTYQNIEVILINDGSTDNSVAVCNEFLYDKRVRFINRENRGLSKTRQEAIDAANGDYFCNLDSDDYLEPTFVEKMLNAAENNEADIVCCERRDFDTGWEIIINLPKAGSISSIDKKSVTDELFEIHRDYWLPDSWNKLYRTIFVKNSGVKYNLDNRYNGTDLLFNHLLILHCPKTVLINEALINHRIVLGSRVHRKNKPLLEGFHIITNQVFEEAKHLNYSHAFFENYSYCYKTFLTLSFDAILNECEKRKELVDRYQSFCKLRDLFVDRNPGISKRLMNDNGGSIYKVLHCKAMLGNSKLLCTVVYGLNRLRCKIKRSH